jgi:Hypothetical protein TTHB210
MSWSAARRGAVLAASVAALAGCSREKLVQGECRTVNGASVCTWGKVSDGRVMAFGATIPMQAIEAAPGDVPMVWPPKADATIPLPAEVKAGTGFDNMTVFWEPHGHPPGPYLTPHFDFHFNTEDVSAIDCADTAKPAAVPAGYELPDVAIPEMGTLVGLCVPAMGMHALSSAELHSTGLFKQTMIVGYYHQRPIFIEPMITKATLMERRSFNLTVPAIPSPEGSRYPATFRAYYDSTAQSYTFALAGFGGGTM